MAKEMEHTAGKSVETVKQYGKPLLAGLIGGCVTLLVMLALCALLVVGAGTPLSMLPVMVIGTVVLSGFFGGYFAARTMKKQGLLLGAVTGVMLALLELGASFVWLHNLPPMAGLSKTAIFVVAAMIGGVLGVNSKKKKKRA